MAPGSTYGRRTHPATHQERPDFYTFVRTQTLLTGAQPNSAMVAGESSFVADAFFKRFLQVFWEHGKVRKDRIIFGIIFINKCLFNFVDLPDLLLASLSVVKRPFCVLSYVLYQYCT